MNDNDKNVTGMLHDGWKKKKQQEKSCWRHNNNILMSTPSVTRLGTELIYGLTHHQIDHVFVCFL